MSSPPKAFTVDAIIASMPSGVPASAAMARAVPPAFVISCATASALAGSMSATPTRAPRAAKPIAVARPMPEPAPDTSATLPSKRMSPPLAVSAQPERLGEALHFLERLGERLAAEIEDELAHAGLLVGADVVGDLLRRARERTS